LLSLVFEELEASPVLFLSVVEYDPLLNPFAAPSLFEVDELELSVELLFEKSPDLNPSPLFELVESLLEVEDLLDEPLNEPELNPLLDFELELLLELDLLPVLLLDFAKATVLFVGFVFVNENKFKGKLENVNINIKSMVKT
jgi:hypothetical protein